MTTPAESSAATLRRSIYWLLIAISVGSMSGRILAVNSVDQIALERYLQRKDPDRSLQRPFLSANDRSRWATARALVEHGTYAIDDIVSQPGWDTIDMVQHRDRDGRLRLYSSKPPLFATLMAGEYWLIHKLTGLQLGQHPDDYLIGRFMIFTINVLPMILYLWVIGRLAERLGGTDWGRIFVVATAALGTYLSTFAVVINNHLPGAVFTAVATALAVRIAWDHDRRWWVSALTGLAAAMAVTEELPALSFFCVLAAVLLWRAPRATLVGFLPAAVLVAAAYLGTNYVAHDSLRPPYAHRQDGPRLFSVGPEWQSVLDEGELPAGLREEFARREVPLSDQAEIEGGTPGERWIVVDPATGHKFAVRSSEGGLAVHEWDNWYDYTFERSGRRIESYWKRTENRSKIDQGEVSVPWYAFNVLIGHHGIFSLTPVWLLMPVGLVMWLTRGDRRLQILAAAIALVTIVCIAFFLTRPLQDRNYGGMTSGFRWVFWLAPLWLVAVLPAADKLAQCRWGRALGLLLLGLSVLSVSYPTWNPWTQPWLTNFFVYMGWAEF